jgi:hypothetical protein
MINQQLVDYVKQQMQAGVSKDVVRKALGDAGWPPADVEDSLKAAEPAGSNMMASTASQTTINPAVAMGGVDVVAKSPAGGSSPAIGSSSDKFFAKPAAASQTIKDGEHPSTKKFLVTMIAMGAVILLLAGALAFVYFNLNAQLDAAQSGNPGDPAQTVSLQQQVTQLTADKIELAAQTQTLTADNQAFLSEMGFFVPPASASSTAPLSATVQGTLTGNASTTFALMTAHNVKVIVLNSKDAKVSAALTALASSTSTVTLAGTHPAGSLNLTVTAVNGAPL